MDRTLYWTLSFYLPRSRLGDLGAGKCCDASMALRRAIDPLFNDVADRSRQQNIPDQLYMASGPEALEFVMPSRIQWTTEGALYTVPIDGPARFRQLNLRRFWYRFPDGAFAWNLSFEYHYGEALASESRGSPPITYYFMSLLQKLAWPKEFQAEPNSNGPDDLIGISVARASEDGQPKLFWEFVQTCFAEDAERLAQECDIRLPSFTEALPCKPSIEVPGIDVWDNRSCFLFHDKAFFNLIQPCDDAGRVTRLSRLREMDFYQYPKWIAEQKKLQEGASQIELEASYWKKVRPRSRDAEARLGYLFLSGFNQNIIDFTNQDASEVLDSLDPIYPRTSEHQEEGFFVRFANPRAMTTYVPNSRTLEVGNKHIGTCPYAFLIHALALHNEALTREQEEETYTAIDRVEELLNVNDAVSAAREIRTLRRNAFEKYERHRYRNPFRYDTERNVFDELELLRGTSRMKEAYQSALIALEQDALDRDRIERELEEKQDQARQYLLNFFFGALSVTGLISVFFQVEQFAHDRPRTLQNWIFVVVSLIFPIIVIMLLQSGISRYVSRQHSQRD